MGPGGGIFWEGTMGRTMGEETAGSLREEEIMEGMMPEERGVWERWKMKRSKGGTWEKGTPSEGWRRLGCRRKKGKGGRRPIDAMDHADEPTRGLNRTNTTTQPLEEEVSFV